MDSAKSMCIVSGPSCVGKTTFLGSAKLSEYTANPPDSKVLFASDEEQDATQASFFHYNILRPIHFLGQRDRFLPYRLAPLESVLVRCLPLRQQYWARLKDNWDYAMDPDWVAAKHSPFIEKALVLVASQQALIQRASSRSVVEAGDDAAYPSGYWVDLYRKLDLVEIYKRWITELQNADIEFVLIDSNTKDYQRLDESIDLRQYVHQKNWK